MPTALFPHPLCHYKYCGLVPEVLFYCEILVSTHGDKRHTIPAHLVLLPLLQRLGDPLQSLLVGQLRPLFAKTVLDVFGGRLLSYK